MDRTFVRRCKHIKTALHGYLFVPILKKCVLVSADRCGSIRALTDGFVAAFGDAVAADHPEKAQIVHFGDTVMLAVPATLDGEGRPQTRVIAPKHCLHCGRCAEICPIGAIESRF